jgi:3-hydroxy-D-aspartate aldolase
MNHAIDPIGRPLGDVPTPVAVLNVDALDHNIATMARALRGFGVEHAPHTKTHKCREIAARQIAAGAAALTCATLREAAVMASVAGVERVLIARPLAADPAKLAAIANLAGRTQLSMTIEDADQVEPLADVCRAAGTRLRLLVELDIGFGRAGVRDVDTAVAVARAVAERNDALVLEGLMGYEAHAMRIGDDLERRRVVHASLDRLTEAAERLTAEGLECPVVSAGGTITYDDAATHVTVTQVRSGGYVFMHARSDPGPASLREFRKALSVLSTVIGSYPDGRVVLDAGLKSVSTDGGTAMEIVDHPDLEVVMVTEEHLVLDASRSARRPRVGERLSTVSTHSCTTANLHPRYVVVHDGDDTVSDVWDVAARL